MKLIVNEEAAKLVINSLQTGQRTVGELSAICNKTPAAMRCLIDTLSFTYPIFENAGRFGILKTDANEDGEMS
jgi:hypothetical protein